MIALMKNDNDNIQADITKPLLCISKWQTPIKNAIAQLIYKIIII